jgi:hypothetical protein
VWAFGEGEGYWSIFCMIVFYRLGVRKTSYFQ